MQSDQWHPSDIENNNGSEAEQTGQRRRLRVPGSSDAPASEQSQGQTQQGASAPQPVRKPPTQGVMTLDRDSGARQNGSFAEEQAPAQPDVRDRLRDASDRCVSCYEAWKTGPDGEDALRNGLHELRRVLARIEIELAANHSEESAMKPIPIPLHRAHKGGY